MDTIHDIPARQESSGGVAQMAQTIAMLADTLARQRQEPGRSPDRASDALSRSATAQTQASAEGRAAAHDLNTPDKPAAPTVDEHAVGVGAGLEHASRAQQETGAAAVALAEARESVAVVRTAASQTSVVSGAHRVAATSRQPAVAGRAR